MNIGIDMIYRIKKIDEAFGVVNRKKGGGKELSQ